ncbi:MAG: N-acetylneuraminate synthase [Desulfobacterales bacterium]|nr:N-acetylneuraminate synthase [Desulfobacterales bacterium]
MHKRTFIIAEAGVNHNGDLDLAIKMVDVAAKCGADAIKFQTFKAENVISRYAPKAEYQKSTTGSVESQLEMVKKLELDESAHKKLVSHCKNKGIIFLSSPFDLRSIDLLDKLRMEIFKIPSGEITNLPYLRKIGALKKRVILSTGMAVLAEIEAAIDVLEAAGTPRRYFTILQCNTEYPTPMSDVNLRAMISIRHAFGVSVGYSDHTLGIEVPIAAVALGATVIEKHLTLDRNLPGPDHRASLEPDEFTSMVHAIRNVEQALGDGIKRPSSSEAKNRAIACKSIVASRSIRAGEFFTSKNVTVKRPGTGLSPMRWDEVIGRHALRDFSPDDLIEI